MTAPVTTDEYLELVTKSGLADPERLEEALKELRAGAAPPSTPKELATSLVKQGVLTTFHAEQFLKGVWKGFRIGKYQILDRIGSGGMGIVYLGEHSLMGTRVAIKVLPVSLADHPWFLKRFYREAQAVAALNHPNIVRAFDIDHSGNLHYIVMEFVEGASLQDIVGKRGPFEPCRACHYIAQAASGLQHLQEVGLIHRDIKPGNLLLDRLGTVKMLDLGLAHFRREQENGASPRDRTMVGTDDYLAPEQIVNSDDVDIRADIYGLGATFYFLLTGNSPFEEAGMSYQKLLRHLAQRPKPVRELRPEVPVAMAAVLEKMMAKNPWERYQTPVAVMEALKPWTRSSIPPPAEEEMPRLCPALQRARFVPEGVTAPAVLSKVGSLSGWQISGSGASSLAGPLSGPLKSGNTPPVSGVPSSLPESRDTATSDAAMVPSNKTPTDF